MEASETTASVTIPGNSYWFSGHFPDNPILPGIAQLKMAVDLVTQHGMANMRLTGLSRIKFRKIVRPEEQLDIQVTCNTAESYYTFKITSGNTAVCSGKMHFTHN